MYTNTLQAQPNFVEKYNSVEFKAISSGQSTGKIGYLSITNDTKDTINLDLTPFYISSNDNHQPYLIPHYSDLKIAPFSKYEHELWGYCAYPFLEPSPQNSYLSDPKKWITIDTTLVGYNKEILENEGWFSDSTSRILNSNTKQELLLSINTLENDYEAAHVVYDIWMKVDQGYKNWSKEKKIITPYSSIPDKEYSTLIQHSLWIGIAELNGLIYSKFDFKEVIYKEINRTFTSSNPTEQELEAIDEGISAFWYSFMKILHLSKTFDISKINKKYAIAIDIEAKKVLDITDKSN